MANAPNPFFGPGNIATFRDNSGDSLVDRRAGVLQMSNDGVAFSPVGNVYQAPPPPGVPFSWIDGSDVNLFGNLGLRDGDVLTTVENKGLLGAAASPTQASGPAKPTIKKIAALGKLRNLGSIAFNGSQWLASPLFTARNANCVVATLFKATNLSGSLFVCDGGTAGRAGLFYSLGTGLLNLSGAGSFATSKSIVAATYHLVICTYAGASSFLELDGAVSTVGNPTSAGMTGITLGSFTGGGSFLNGEIVEQVANDDGTTPAAIRAYFAGKYGPTPQ